MNRLAAIAFALALMPLPAAAAEPQSAPSGDATTMLHLSEQAERMVARDRLGAVLRVEGSDADAARLQADINRRMAAAVARAKGVPGVTVSTGGYSVYQEHPKQGPAQWHGSASLTLAAQEAAPLLALVGTLQQNGLALSSLAYELSPEAARAVEDELTAEALARLRQRAERVARSLGLSVLRIGDLRLGNAGGIVPMPRPLFVARMREAAPAPAAEPGEATVSVSVDADVLLVPKR